MSRSSASGQSRTSLVDVAEEALRRWLATGRHRVGERLPPEQELSGQLGISRGTLRTALGRLERSGEIVRRQGSGTYVGEAAAAAGRLEGQFLALVADLVGGPGARRWGALLMSGAHGIAGLEISGHLAREKWGVGGEQLVHMLVEAARPGVEDAGTRG